MGNWAIFFLYVSCSKFKSKRLVKKLNQLIRYFKLMYIAHIQCKVLRWKYKKHSLIGPTSQKNIISFSKYCGNIVFLKKCTRIWSVLYYQVDGKWKMIFHKRIQDNMIFSAIILQRRSFQKICSGIWSFLYYQEIYLFFPKIWSYS